jgi:hypothetical protein
MQTMYDETENARRARQAELNTEAAAIEELSRRYGTIWNAEALRQEFEVLGFMAPFVVVRQKATGKKGSLEFQHSPRFYFNWQVD